MSLDFAPIPSANPCMHSSCFPLPYGDPPSCGRESLSATALFDVFVQERGQPERKASPQKQERWPQTSALFLFYSWLFSALLVAALAASQVLAAGLAKGPLPLWLGVWHRCGRGFRL